MALNKYMHERNIYKHKKPDFQALAVKYDYFREKVTQSVSGKVILDFKDPNAMRALTRALLEYDFGLSVDLPLDRLIPMVPQRLNYILWLEDILGQDGQIRGIDIGTGASCIFPLLGCRQNRWEFLASDIDEQNIYFAKQNVEKNEMQGKITIKKVSEDTILCGLVEDEMSYDFCMCNPPFYTDHLEAQGISSSRSPDRPEPSSMSTASETESIAWGGEVRFVCRMIEESLVLKDKIRVYTSMLGKKASLSLLKDELVKKKIPKFSTTEFCQGKTMRWGIAWTFDNTVDFPKSSFKTLKNVKPPLVYEVPRSAEVVSDYTVQAYTHFIKQELDQLKIHFFVKHSGKFYTGLVLKATENNWSHQRKKRRQKKRNSASESSEQVPDKQNCASDSSEQVQDQPNSASESSEQVPNKQNSASDSPKQVPNKQNSASESTEQVPDKQNSASESTEQVPDKLNSVSESTEQVPDKLAEDISDSTDFAGAKRTQNTDDKPKEADTLSNAVEDTESMTEADIDKGDKTSEISSSNGVTEQESSDLTKNKVDSNKRKAEDDKNDKNGVENCKKVKLETDSAEPHIDLEASWLQASKGAPADRIDREEHAGNQTEGSAVISRAEVVKQFWKEQGTSSTKTSAPKSAYQSQEPFEEHEECIVQCKLELRKEEGVIRLIMTYLTGSKEALAQILQYFKNTITTVKCEYGKTDKEEIQN